MSAPMAEKSRKASADPYGIDRLATSEAKTPRGMTQLAARIIEKGLPQPALIHTEKVESPSRKDQRCVSLDPNAYRTRALFNRIRCPREERKRRREGWADARFFLPKLLMEGLRVMTNEVATQQANSDWSQERGKYPVTKNFHVTAAINAYLKSWGYEQFCVEEQPPRGVRVRRFLAPKD
jgi:hypothetical protein